jgi:hypothetical protein
VPEASEEPEEPVAPEVPEAPVAVEETVELDAEAAQPEPAPETPVEPDREAE